MNARRLALAMPEDRGPGSLEAHLRDLLDDYGLWGYHTRNSIGAAKGWPDWVILGPAGVLFRELKSESGIVTPEQRMVGALLTKAGLNWNVWRPRDYYDRRIHRELAAIAAHPKLWEETA